MTVQLPAIVDTVMTMLDDASENPCDWVFLDPDHDMVVHHDFNESLDDAVAQICGYRDRAELRFQCLYRQAELELS